nr:hypothetical protein [Tanacetum cinerariifolium]
MMELVPVEEVYVEAQQVKHLIIDWEIHTEGQRTYWKIIRLGGSTAIYQFFVDMLKHFDREDLNQVCTLVRETLSIRQATSDKEKELWVEMKRLYEPDVEDQLWIQTQALMHDLVEWRLYDSCGVHYGRIAGNKMLKAFLLPVMSSHYQKTFPLLVKKGSPVEKRDATAEKIALLMKTGVIVFDDSYEAPKDVVDTSSASEGSTKKKERTIAVTTENIQKKRNDVKARATLLLALPREHQLRFSKYKTAQELWAAILKTFGGNEATRKTKKNKLKQQYRNFKVEGKETLEKTFNRLQAINMALLSMRADRYWKKTRKKISFQGTDVAGFDKLKVECFNCHKMGHFARECRAPRSQDRGRRENFKQGSKVEESAPKALMVIDRVGWEWSYMANEEEDHALVADQEAPTEFALMAKSSSDTKMLKKEKEGLDSKLIGFQSASKDLDTLLGSQRSDKNKEGLGYIVVPPPPAQVYSPPKKDMSWTGLPEFADDTITDYSRPSPNKESKLNDLQNNSSYVSENEESTSSILSKPEIKFVKAADSPTLIKTSKDETVRKPSVKYTEMYRKTSKSSNVSGNQRN